MTVVPDGWMLYTPHDVAGLAKDALIIGPFGSNLKTIDYRDEGVPLVFVKDIRAEDFSRPRAYVSTAKAAELVAHQVLPGDILITKMGEPPGDTALYDGNMPGIITADCIRLRPTSGFDRKFLVHSLRTPNARRQIDAITTGAAQKKVSLDRFRTRLNISAPPLAEQKRIAAVLDQVDTLRAKRREAIALLDGLALSLFIEMFGDPEENPKEWRLCSLGELIATGPSNGIYKPATDYGRGVPVLRIDSFQSGSLKDPSDWRLVDASPVEQERYQLSKGDIVINRVNSRSHLGKSVMVGDVPDGAVFESNMMRFRVDDNVALPLFVEQFMQTGYVRNQVLEAAKDAVNQSSINQRDVKELRVYVPPLKNQREYVQRVTAIREQVEGHQTHLATLEELFVSLQQRAFSGTLWDHDGEAGAA